jgi:hypothetical protein
MFVTEVPISFLNNTYQWFHISFLNNTTHLREACQNTYINQTVSLADGPVVASSLGWEACQNTYINQTELCNLMNFSAFFVLLILG